MASEKDRPAFRMTRARRIGDGFMSLLIRGGLVPHSYLLTRRLERAAALLRMTDRSVAEICLDVGLQSIGSFTTSFTRMFGKSPAAYRASQPPAVSRVVVPSCVVRAYE